VEFLEGAATANPGPRERKLTRRAQKKAHPATGMGLLFASVILLGRAANAPFQQKFALRLGQPAPDAVGLADGERM